MNNNKMYRKKKNDVGECGLDSRVSGSGPVAGCFEDGSELSSSMTFEKRLYQRSDSLLFKDVGPCSSIVWHLFIFYHLQ
jgi:hypothetical protein